MRGRPTECQVRFGWCARDRHYRRSKRARGLLGAKAHVQGMLDRHSCKRGSLHASEVHVMGKRASEVHSAL